MVWYIWVIGAILFLLILFVIDLIFTKKEIVHGTVSGREHHAAYTTHGTTQVANGSGGFNTMPTIHHHPERWILEVKLRDRSKVNVDCNKKEYEEQKDDSETTIIKKTGVIFGSTQYSTR